MMVFKIKYQDKLSTIKSKISNLLEFKFRFAFKEFLVLDIGESVPLREKREFFQFLYKTNNNNIWEHQREIRALWQSDLTHLPTNAQFLDRVAQNNAHLIGIINDVSSLMKEGLGISFNEQPNNKKNSESGSLSYEHTASESQSQNNYDNPPKFGQSTLQAKNLKIKEYVVAITAMFLEVNQITSFQMHTFSNELNELAEKLSDQLKISLMKSFLNAPMEEMSKFTTAPQVRLKLASDYFQIQWNFFLRLFALAKLHLFGLAHVSHSKGVTLTEPYIAKLIHDFYFIISAQMNRLMEGLQQLLAALFSNDLTIQEVLGLKSFFVSLYQTTSAHVYSLSGFGLPESEFGKEELLEIKNAEKKLTHQLFLNKLWQTELSVINCYAASRMRRLQVFVQKEDWKDMNVSFDIVDQLAFILNNNAFMKRHVGRVKEFPIKSENTLVVINQKNFR